MNRWVILIVGMLVFLGVVHFVNDLDFETKTYPNSEYEDIYNPNTANGNLSNIWSDDEYLFVAMDDGIIYYYIFNGTSYNFENLIAPDTRYEMLNPNVRE